MQTLRARPALAIVFALLALLLLTGVAYAIGRSLGYLPGIGIVDSGAQLRVLAEPVNQTRDSVTVSIEQVVVDSERTVVIYKTEGLTIEAANSKGEGANTYYDNFIRLADGTLLKEASQAGYDGTPEPLITTLTTEGGWPNYVRRLVFPPIAPEINELTLILPGLQNMPAGTVPENWEIAFHLKPAPADLTFVPILEIMPQASPIATGIHQIQATNPAPLSNVSTLHGVTLRLDNVIEVENGYVFTGKLTWDAAAFPPNQGVSINVSELLTVSDGDGQKVPIEQVQLNAVNGERERLWSFRTDRKNFAGPLLFSVSPLKANLTLPPSEFELDLGSHPQVGQTWELNREFSTGGQAVRITSVQLVQDSASHNFCLAFDLENTEWGGLLQDLDSGTVNGSDCYDSDSRSYGGSGFHGKPINIFTQLVAYPDIPAGLHHFSLAASVSYTLPGPWQVVWNPPAASEPLPTSQPEACLTLDKWKELVARDDTLPARLNGKILFNTYDPNSGANFATLHLANPDGSDFRTLVNGGWPTLSSDGRTLGYVNETGLNVLDLATGQNSTLSNDGYNMIWSPDNTRIMYTNTFNLFVANADGSTPQTIDTGSAQVIAPAGWQDNQTIIYSVMGGEGFTFKSHNLQSSETKDLFLIHHKAGFGSVSPDGQWIVFADHVFGNLGWSNFIARLDGSDRRLIADADAPAAFNSVWSPDGQWLILNTYNPENPDGEKIPVLVNPFTCQAIRMNMIHGQVEDWGP